MSKAQLTDVLTVLIEEPNQALDRINTHIFNESKKFDSKKLKSTSKLLSKLNTDLDTGIECLECLAKSFD